MTYTQKCLKTHIFALRNGWHAWVLLFKIVLNFQLFIVQDEQQHESNQF